MKRTFKTLLAAAALAFVGLGSLLTATPAEAAITNVGPFNGITCRRYDGQNWPGNSHYYDCTVGAPYTGYNATAQGTINVILGSAAYPNVKNVLQTAPVSTSIFIFNNAVDMKAWFTTTPWGTPAERQQIWTQYKGITGSTLDPAAPAPCQSRIFVAFGSGNYPTVTVQGVSQFQSTVAHEIGHCYDAYAGGSLANRPSGHQGMINAAAKDKAYLIANAPNGTGQSLYNTYVYWLGDNAELFAQQFSYSYTGGNAGVNSVLAPYYACTRFYTQFWMKNQADPTPQNYTAGGLSRCN